MDEQAYLAKKDLIITRICSYHFKVILATWAAKIDEMKRDRCRVFCDVSEQVLEML